MIVYKVLREDGTPYHGGKGKWVLPNFRMRWCYPRLEDRADAGVNGCDATVQAPSRVLCAACLARLNEKFKALATALREAPHED